MSRKKQKKKNTNQKGIEIIIGIVCLIFIFFGVLKIDEDGSISVAGYHLSVDEQNDLNELNDGNQEENKIENENSSNGTSMPVSENSSNITSTPVSENDLQIYYLDVGQADSIFVYQDNECMLIDAGNNNDGKKICEYLDSLGITKIDYLVGTHAHEDHIGGLDDVINHFEIGKIYMPKKSATTKTFEDVIDAISEKNLKVTSPQVGSTFQIGNAVCEVMAVDDNAKDANLSSIVIEMTYGTQKFLFTGDMEEENEKAGSWHDIDVLKVAHHGSSTSSSEEFLEQTKPEIAIISCGKDNDYGHPHKETLEKLEKIGCEVYRTDLLGTIRLTSDGTTNKLEFLEVSCDGNKK